MMLLLEQRTLLLLFFAYLSLPQGNKATSTSAYPLENVKEVREVEGVEGGEVELPCDLFPQDEEEDKINLILWYKNEGKDPIYSYDARMAVFSSERHHLKESLLKGRVSFNPSPGEPVPHKLTLSRLEPSDAGSYTCRVDFTMAQSSSQVVLLKLVTPVSSLTIVDAQGRQVPSVLNPIPEGGTLNITCTARGGNPQPSVSWWVADAMIDDSWTEVAKGVISNNLVLSPLTRAHAHALLTCRATPSVVAVTTATVTIDMFLRPEAVDITTGGSGDTVTAGNFLDLTCTARGSRPSPIIMWYKGTEVIETKKAALKDVVGVSAVSHARLKVNKADDGVTVTCRVTNPSLPHHTLQEQITLNVTYPPEVELRMGSTLEGTVVKEKSDLYLTCHVDGNPLPESVTFTHQGVVMQQDLDKGIVLSGQDLVLRGIQRSQSGLYNCRATNIEGTGISPSLNITVLYAPVCKETSSSWVDLNSQVTASCSVNSSPSSSLHFSWVWVTPTYSRRIMPALVTTDNLTSNVTFVIPKDNNTLTELGPANKLGTLQCWARNEVGRQETPCTIDVLRSAECNKSEFGGDPSDCMKPKKRDRRPPTPAPVPPPKSTINCTLTGVGHEKVRVTCTPGDKRRKTPQTYQLQIYEAKTRKLHINVTSNNPSFLVHNLTAGRDYTVYVSSHTSQGGSPFKLVEAFNFKTAENRMRKDEEEFTLSWTYILIIGGSAGGVIILILLVVAGLRVRSLRSPKPVTVRRTETPNLNDKNLYRENSPDEPLSEMRKYTAETVADPEITTQHQHHLPSIIRQSNPGRLQPIIKENGRAEPIRSVQPRTVLFVEPSSAVRSDDSLNGRETPSSPQNSWYSTGQTDGTTGMMDNKAPYKPARAYVSKSYDDYYAASQYSPLSRGAMNREPGFTGKESRHLDEPVLTARESGYLDRDSRLMNREPQLMSRESGLLDRDSTLRREPGLLDRDSTLRREPALLDRDPQHMSREPGLLERDSRLSREFGILDRDPHHISREAGLLDRDARLCRESGLLDRDSRLGREPGLLDRDSRLGRESGLLDRDSRLGREPGLLDRDSRLGREPGLLDRDSRLGRESGFLERDSRVGRESGFLDRDSRLSRESGLIDRSSRLNDKGFGQFDRDSQIMSREPGLLDRDSTLRREPGLFDRELPNLNRDSSYSSHRKAPLSSYREYQSMSASDIYNRDSSFDLPHSSSLKSNYYDSHLRRTSSSPTPPRPSIMKKSTSAATTSSHLYNPVRTADGSSPYRSLPRASRGRQYSHDGALTKYRSLDRRFDLPYTGSLPKPEGKHRSLPDTRSYSDSQSDHRFDIRTDVNSRYGGRGSSLHDYDSRLDTRKRGLPHRRFSGSTRLKFSDEKYFHVYPDKDKQQNCLDDDDENFV